MMRFSRFDYAVWAVAAALIATIALTVQFGTPPVIGLQVAYLYPASGPFNIYLADPANPGGASQITDVRRSVYDYDVAPDGRSIVYAEQDEELGTSELMFLPLVGANRGSATPLTNCRQEDSDCVAPKWRPGSQSNGQGGAIAYQRRDLNTELGLGVSPTRLWMLDLNREPPTTYPLFDDSQILGSEHRWSRDGGKLGFFEGFGGNIMVYDFNASNDDDRIRVIPSNYGTVGTFSPDATQIVFPRTILPTEQQSSTTVLGIADLNTNVYRQLTPDDTYVNDGPIPAWHPDGTRIAFTRKYLDERITLGEQIYLYDVETGGVSQLIYDENYAHGALSWSPDGTMLLFQRFNYTTSLPEIWVYSVTAGTLTQIVANAWYGLWVPAPDG